MHFVLIVYVYAVEKKKSQGLRRIPGKIVTL